MKWHVHQINGIAMWGLSEAWKAKNKVHSRLFKKLVDILNCAASGDSSL